MIRLRRIYDGLTRRVWSIRAAAVLLGVLIAGFVLSEIALRIFLPQRSINENFTVYDSTYGKRFKKNLHTNRMTPVSTVTFSTNQLGFRGKKLDEIPKGAILVLGDSFALGYGVSDGSEFPSVVEQKLRSMHRINDIAVVNAAIGDTGTGRWLKFLRTDADQYEPRLIILQMTGSDYADDQRERLFGLAADYSLLEMPVPKPEMYSRILRFLKDIPAVRSLQIMALLRTAAQVIPAPAAEKDHTAGSDVSLGRLTERIVEEILREARWRNWPVLGLAVEIYGERLASLDRLFRAYGSDLIVEPDRTDRPELYFPSDEHWNELGNRVVADIVLRWLWTHRETWLDGYETPHAWAAGTP